MSVREMMKERERGADGSGSQARIDCRKSVTFLRFSGERGQVRGKRGERVTRDGSTPRLPPLA